MLCPDASAPGRPGDSLRAIHQYLRVLPKGGCESVPMERRMEMRTRGEARSANKPNRGGVFLSVILLIISVLGLLQAVDA